ncbi:DUF2270 domain-containing protein [Mesorhizobium sp. f-mel]
MGESLRTPKFLISQRAALARRLRRNYIRMLLILLMAWILMRSWVLATMANSPW